METIEDNSCYCNVCGNNNDCYICVSQRNVISSSSISITHDNTPEDVGIPVRKFFPCSVCGLQDPYPGYENSPICYCGSKLESITSPL